MELCLDSKSNYDKEPEQRERGEFGEPDHLISEQLVIMTVITDISIKTMQRALN